MTLIIAIILQKPNMGLASHDDGKTIFFSLGSHAAEGSKWMIRSDVG